MRRFPSLPDRSPAPSAPAAFSGGKGQQNEDDFTTLDGSFTFHETVRFPGELDSIPLTCDGTL